MATTTTTTTTTLAAAPTSSPQAAEDLRVGAQRTVRLTSDDVVSGQEVTYFVHETATSQSTLLLLHANPGSVRDFDGILDALVTRWRVVSLAWPGYGESPLAAPETNTMQRAYAVLAAFLDDARMPPVVILGNSMGAGVAVRLAASHPDKVKGLVLVSPAGFTKHTYATRTFCRFMASSWALSPATFGRMYTKHRRGPFIQDVLQRYQKVHSRPQIRAAIRAAWSSFTLPINDVREAASIVTQPTLIVWGKYDPVVVPSSEGKTARAMMPTAKYVELPTGHVVFAEDPQAFLDVVVPFLSELKW